MPVLKSGTLSQNAVWKIMDAIPTIDQLHETIRLYQRDREGQPADLFSLPETPYEKHLREAATLAAGLLAAAMSTGPYTVETTNPT